MEESPFWHNFHLNRYVGLLSDGLLSDGLLSDGLLSDGLLSDGLLSDGLHDPEKTMPTNVKNGP